jgi:uridine kinase
MTKQDLEAICTCILKTQASAGHRASLIAISGIDASGKGYVSEAIARELTALGKRVALIGIDGWLNLPAVRFRARESGRHFYTHALRFNEMFRMLIDPLIARGSVDCVADFADETAQSFRKHRYQFQDVEIVLLEGIFLFRRDLCDRYDLRVWIECSFETALHRAVARGQEGLPPAETWAAFESIYFPAQRVHFTADKPHNCADIVIDNG